MGERFQSFTIPCCLFGCQSAGRKNRYHNLPGSAARPVLFPKIDSVLVPVLSKNEVAMIEPDESQNWDSLLEDLGLTSPEPTSQPPRQETPRAPARSVDKPAPAPESRQARQESAPSPEPAPAAFGTEEAVPTSSGEEAPRDDGKEARGRRGRRGGRSAERGPVAEAVPTQPEKAVAQPSAAEGSAKTPAAVEGGEAESAEERRGRRRRRRRRPDEREPAPRSAAKVRDPDEDEVEPSEEPVVAAGGDDDDDEDDLSNWSVPPWNDLIASLYRPDR
jgi:hypothetical protein